MAAQSGTLTPAEERRQVLLYAATHGRSDIVGRVLEEERKDHSPDVSGLLASQPDLAQGTALHVASRLGHVDVIRLLLNRSAAVDVRDLSGKTALEVALTETPAAKRPAARAAYQGELFRRCATGDADGVEALVQGGLGLDCDQDGYSLEAWASLFDQIDVVMRLKRLANGSVDEAIEGGHDEGATSQSEAATNMGDGSLQVGNFDVFPCDHDHVDAASDGSDAAFAIKTTTAVLPPLPDICNDPSWIVCRGFAASAVSACPAAAVFPRLWPPLRRQALWAATASSSSRDGIHSEGDAANETDAGVSTNSLFAAELVFPAVPQDPLPLDLPPELTPSEADALAGIIVASFRDAAAASTVRAVMAVAGGMGPVDSVGTRPATKHLRTPALNEVGPAAAVAKASVFVNAANAAAIATARPAFLPRLSLNASWFGSILNGGLGETPVDAVLGHEAAALSFALKSSAVGPGFPRAPGSFRLLVVPGGTGKSCGRVEAVAPDLDGLRSAAQVLAQLLRYHASVPLPCQQPSPFPLPPTRGNAPTFLAGSTEAVAAASAAEVRLPGAVLSEGGEGDVSPSPAVLFDVWKLWSPPAAGLAPPTSQMLVELPVELRAALASLAAWRVLRIYVPVPLDTVAGNGQELLPARLFRIRAACEPLGLELVPLLELPFQRSLLDGTATGALLRVLAQFQGVGSRPAVVALRLGGVDGVPALKAATATLARADEACRLAAAAGISGSILAGNGRQATLTTELWLSEKQDGLMHEVARAVTDRFGLSGCGPAARTTPSPPCRLAFTLETAADAWNSNTGVAVAGGDEGLAATVGLFANLGIPIRRFAAAPFCGSASLPSHVLPSFQIRERVAAFGGFCLHSRRAGAEGTVIEVPTYGPPWCGPVRRQRPCPSGGGGGARWCRLSAFLAAGFARDPEASLVALGCSFLGAGWRDGVDDRSASRIAAGASDAPVAAGIIANGGDSTDFLSEMLATHVLAQPLAAEAQAAGPLALALWDAPVPLPPDGLIESVLSVLKGKIPQLRDPLTRAEVVQGINVWYHQLRERRDHLLSFDVSSGNQTAAIGSSGGAAASREECGESIFTSSSELPAALLGLDWLRFGCRILLLLAKYAPSVLESASTTKSAKEAENNGVCDAGELTWEREVAKMTAAMGTIPRTKCSDMRNSFLRLVERTADISPGDFVDGSPRSNAAGHPIVGFNEGVVRAAAAEEAAGWSVFDATNDVEADIHKEGHAFHCAAQVLWRGGLRLGAVLELEPWSTFSAATKTQV
eukprot:TRINITY_DN37542_c0_g1_i1.p1 TRINITY_DN37542_c0_g1~~TRINITY_DN37542_c0_g1_i1.p1  ORF type:complete len:1290 (+),score=253.94 TRINITY_DN37542_c0_g1_i1:56-3871(+)